MPTSGTQQCLGTAAPSTSLLRAPKKTGLNNPLNCAHSRAQPFKMFKHIVQGVRPLFFSSHRCRRLEQASFYYYSGPNFLVCWAKAFIFLMLNCVRILIIVVGFVLRSAIPDEVRNPTKNIIMGTQKGLLPHEVRVFLASLRSTGCNARVLIFSADENRPDLDELATTFQAEISFYNITELSQHGPMNLHRFWLFRDELERTIGSPYDQVFNLI